LAAASLVEAHAPLASEKDTPASPNAGKTLLRRLLFEERFDMAQFSHRCGHIVQSDLLRRVPLWVNTLVFELFVQSRKVEIAHACAPSQPGSQAKLVTADAIYGLEVLVIPAKLDKVYGSRKEIGMAYTVTSDTVGLAIGPVAETANDVHEALSKARQMCDAGLANVSIADQAGHKIDGDELLDCIAGKKKITEDLRSV
jgi:hypothetical protein